MEVVSPWAVQHGWPWIWRRDAWCGRSARPRIANSPTILFTGQEPIAIPALRRSRIGSAPKRRRIALLSARCGLSGGRSASQRHPSAFLGRPIARVIHLDRLERQRKVGERLPSRGGALHEVLDFLQI